VYTEKIKKILKSTNKLDRKARSLVQNRDLGISTSIRKHLSFSAVINFKRISIVIGRRYRQESASFGGDTCSNHEGRLLFRWRKARKKI